MWWMSWSPNGLGMKLRRLGRLTILESCPFSLIPQPAVCSWRPCPASVLFAHAACGGAACLCAPCSAQGTFTPSVWISAGFLLYQWFSLVCYGNSGYAVVQCSCSLSLSLFLLQWLPGQQKRWGLKEMCFLQKPWSCIKQNELTCAFIDGLDYGELVSFWTPESQRKTL